jgi:hippurate hydrolase
MNDAALTARTAAVFTTAFGEHARLMPAAWTAGEDYAEFVSTGVPSLFFALGIYDPARIAEARANGTPLPANHSPKFAPSAPEPTIKIGVTAMTLAVMNVLAPH